MKKIWDDEAWEDYLYWQTQDKKTLRRINQLIRDAERDPFRGLGKRISSSRSTVRAPTGASHWKSARSC